MKIAKKDLTNIGVTNATHYHFPIKIEYKHFKRLGVLFLFFGLSLFLINLTSCKKEKEVDESATGTFTDTRDNHTYSWMRIGGHVWMSENFAYAPSSGVYCAFNDDSNNVAFYGYLYSWDTAKAIAPSGWHLPTKAEWDSLIDALGGLDVAGGKMKTVTTGSGDAYWLAPNEGATNESGFSAVPAGVRYTSGSFSFLHGHCRYWESDHPMFYALDYNSEALVFSGFSVSSDECYSVRYVKN